MIGFLCCLCQVGSSKRDLRRPFNKKCHHKADETLADDIKKNFVENDVPLPLGVTLERTRYSYQLTLAWLHVLKVQAYNEYCQTGYGSHEPVEMWEKRLRDPGLLTHC